MRPPASFPDRRILGGRCEGAGVGFGIDHRRDQPFGAEVEDARGEREIADRHPDHRRRATLTHRGNAGQKRANVPQSVLAFEHDGRKAFAADRLRDDWIGQLHQPLNTVSPARKPPRQSEGGNGHGRPGVWERSARERGGASTSRP